MEASKFDDLQLSVASLQAAVAGLASRSTSLWDASIKLLGSISEQAKNQRALYAQLNLLLMFVEKRLSSTEQFAEFVADVAEANDPRMARPDMEAIQDVARTMLAGELGKHLSSGRPTRPSSPKPLPANVAIFPPSAFLSSNTK